MQGLCFGGDPGKHSMLKQMACISNGLGDVHTLDMDAITAAYLWSESLFRLASFNVTVDRTTGATTLSSMCSGSPGECREVAVATGFDATTWVQQLRSML